MFNFVTKTPYSGKNVGALEEAAMMFGFSSEYWMTFKQAMELGLSVKGQSGTQIVRIVLKKVRDRDTGEVKKIRVPKRYTVFNLDQTSPVEEVA
jgi:antirestriction protein ArdC